MTMLTCPPVPTASSGEDGINRHILAAGSHSSKILIYKGSVGVPSCPLNLRRGPKWSPAPRDMDHRVGRVIYSGRRVTWAYAEITCHFTRVGTAGFETHDPCYQS